MPLSLRLTPLMYLPLFVGLPGLSIPLLYLWGFSISRDSINLSASVVLCGVGLASWLLRGAHPVIARHITWSVLLLSASLLSGLLIAPDGSNVLFYGQTVVPLFAAFYGYSVTRSERDLDRFVSWSSATTGVFVAILIITLLWQYGPILLISERMSVMREMAVAIPQFKNYYPVVVLATFSFSLARFLFARQNRHGAALWLSAHAVFLPLCWSRSGVLGFIVCVAVQLWIAIARSNPRFQQRALLAISVIAATAGFASLRIGSTVSARTDVHSVGNASDSRRLEYFIEGSQRVADSPLLGDMFIPVTDRIEEGYVADVKRLYAAHNQYVDLALRGGPVYLLLTLVFLSKAISRCTPLIWRTDPARDDRLLMAGAAIKSFLLASLIGANFQLYFIQMQTAVPIYAVAGLAFRCHRLYAQRGARPDGAQRARPALRSTTPRLARAA